MKKRILLLFIIAMFLDCFVTVKKSSYEIEKCATVKNGYVFEGKQPMTFNWCTFVEILNDSIIIATYNLDKPPTVNLTGEKIVLLKLVDLEVDEKQNCIIAANEKLKFILNKKGKYELKWTDGYTTNLKIIESARLNSVKNKVFLSSERNRIRINYGQNALSQVDSLFRINRLYELAENCLPVDFIKFYEQNILPKHNRL